MQNLATAGEVRGAVRAFLDENFDRDISLRTWLERLADSGWAAPQWPALRSLCASCRVCRVASRCACS
jgi:hypothetical protein